jgi:hypothetical protein
VQEPEQGQDAAAERHDRDPQRAAVRAGRVTGVTPATGSLARIDQAR